MQFQSGRAICELNVILVTESMHGCILSSYTLKCTSSGRGLAGQASWPLAAVILWLKTG